MHHNNHSRTFFRWFWFLVILYLIAGIAAGIVYPKPIDHAVSYSLDAPEAVFNWLLMVLVWLSGVIPTAIIYAVYAHLENQEIQIDMLASIREANRQNAGPQSKVHENELNQPAAVNIHSTWVCKRCGATNQSYDERCMKCDGKK